MRDKIIDLESRIPESKIGDKKNIERIFFLVLLIIISFISYFTLRKFKGASVEFSIIYASIFLIVPFFVIKIMRKTLKLNSHDYNPMSYQMKIDATDESLSENGLCPIRKSKFTLNLKRQVESELFYVSSGIKFVIFLIGILMVTFPLFYFVATKEILALFLMPPLIIFNTKLRNYLISKYSS